MIIKSQIRIINTEWQINFKWTGKIFSNSKEHPFPTSVNNPNLIKRPSETCSSSFRWIWIVSCVKTKMPLALNLMPRFIDQFSQKTSTNRAKKYWTILMTTWRDWSKAWLWETTTFKRSLNLLTNAIESPVWLQWSITTLKRMFKKTAMPIALL